MIALSARDTLTYFTSISADLDAISFGMQVVSMATSAASTVS